MPCIRPYSLNDLIILADAPLFVACIGRRDAIDATRCIWYTCSSVVERCCKNSSRAAGHALELPTVSNNWNFIVQQPATTAQRVPRAIDQQPQAASGSAGNGPSARTPAAGGAGREPRSNGEHDKATVRSEASRT